MPWLAGPRAASVDTNNNDWVSNLTTTAAGTVQWCGGKLWNCPPGTKTGDAIAAPGGLVGSRRQLQVGIGPAGDVWVNNNGRTPPHQP